MSKKEQKVINELISIMKKHRSLGALHLIECFRIAYEKEIGYMKRGKNKLKNIRRFICPSD
jgi:hypothetical protein